MGYGMSKQELDPDLCDNQQTSGGAHVRQRHDKDFDIDNEIFYLIRLRSEPSESTRKSTHARRKMPISTVRMLSGREGNCSGRGRFSLSDCSYVLGRYLPVNGPCLVDRMDTRAYVSQFSADGSLFVAGFQVGFFFLDQANIAELFLCGGLATNFFSVFMLFFEYLLGEPHQNI